MHTAHLEICECVFTCVREVINCTVPHPAVTLPANTAACAQRHVHSSEVHARVSVVNSQLTLFRFFDQSIREKS